MAGNVQSLSRCSFILLISLLAPMTAAAERHALLVGVSEYPNAPELRLTGPGNDVALIREVLQAKGFSAAKIRTLADGVPGAKLPTRQAILDELARLATRVSRGDIVYLHFSGHGSRQPNQDEGNDDWEADGLDEIFL
ncbi:MAG: caspase family protein, partial [bacterium]|nr:caspase family protein [bacterium]